MSDPDRTGKILLGIIISLGFIFILVLWGKYIANNAKPPVTITQEIPKAPEPPQPALNFKSGDIVFFRANPSYRGIVDGVYDESRRWYNVTWALPNFGFVHRIHNEQDLALVPNDGPKLPAEKQ